MMFFGVATLPEMVTVVVLTAPEGVELGLAGDELDELELPQAAMAKPAAAARAAAFK